MPSTGSKRLSDSVKFKHHAIAIPELTPSDRILEAARQLDSAIKQQSKEAPMDEITAVEILRKVLTGNPRSKLPLTSVQEAKQKHKASAKANPVTAKPPQATQAPAPDPQPNYMSDNEDEEDANDGATVKRSNCSHSPRTTCDEDWDVDSIPELHPGIRRSKCTMQ